MILLRSPTQYVPRSLPSVPTESAGTQLVVTVGSVTGPFWYPKRTPPAVLLAGILNHMLIDAGPVVGTSWVGSRRYDDVPLKLATVASPSGPPVTPSVTLL